MTHAPGSLLLFDVDGTLLKTAGAGMRAMRRACWTLFGDAFTLDGIVVAGHLDPLIFAEAMAINGHENTPANHEAFRDHYLQNLREELENHTESVRALPGIHPTIETLRSPSNDGPNTTLGLLTGNYTEAVPIKLQAVGLDPTWFDITAFGDEADSRPDLVDLARRKYAQQFDQAIDPQRVLIIGDTPRDIACAHAHGCVAFAVATGSYSIEQLRQAGADIVVENLADPSPLVDWVNQTQ